MLPTQKTIKNNIVYDYLFQLLQILLEEFFCWKAYLNAVTAFKLPLNCLRVKFILSKVKLGKTFL